MKILTKRAFLLTLLMCSLMVFAVGVSSQSRRGKVTADLGRISGSSLNLNRGQWGVRSGNRCADHPVQAQV